VKVDIHASNVEKIFNADVINMEGVVALTEAERAKLAGDLAAQLQEWARSLAAKPGAPPKTLELARVETCEDRDAALRGRAFACSWN
jgi:hypothetical protein